MRILLLTLISILPFYTVSAQGNSNTQISKFMISFGHNQTVISNTVPGKSAIEYGLGYISKRFFIAGAYGVGYSNHSSHTTDLYENFRYGIIEANFRLNSFFTIGPYLRRGGGTFITKWNLDDYRSDDIESRSIGISPKLLLSHQHFMLSASLRIPLSGRKDIYRIESLSGIQNSRQITRLSQGTNFLNGNPLDLAVRISYLF